jgi:hypothetical protein
MMLQAVVARRLLAEQLLQQMKTRLMPFAPELLINKVEQRHAWMTKHQISDDGMLQQVIQDALNS